MYQFLFIIFFSKPSDRSTLPFTVIKTKNLNAQKKKSTHFTFKRNTQKIEVHYGIHEAPIDGDNVDESSRQNVPVPFFIVVKLKL